MLGGIFSSCVFGVFLRDWESLGMLGGLDFFFWRGGGGCRLVGWKSY